MRERRVEDTEVVDKEVGAVSKVERRKVMGRMKGRKALGPDNIPVDA